MLTTFYPYVYKCLNLFAHKKICICKQKCYHSAWQSHVAKIPKSSGYKKILYPLFQSKVYTQEYYIVCCHLLDLIFATVVMSLRSNSRENGVGFRTHFKSASSLLHFFFLQLSHVIYHVCLPRRLYPVGNIFFVSRLTLFQLISTWHLIHLRSCCVHLFCIYIFF